MTERRGKFNRCPTCNVKKQTVRRCERCARLRTLEATYTTASRMRDTATDAKDAA